MRRWVPYALFLTCGVITVTIALYVAITIDSRARARFETGAHEINHQTEDRLNNYVEVVRATAALFASSNETNVSEFRGFVSKLALAERYPGLDGIGFSQRIYRRDLASAVRSISLDSSMNLDVSPRGNRPEYYPIIFLESADRRDRRPIGLDLWTDPVQRAAMERARDSGLPALSAGTSAGDLMTGDTAEAVVLYVPIYRSAASTQNVAERRQALVGFVLSLLRPLAIFTHISRATPSLPYEVYDSADRQTATLLHRSGRGDGIPEYQSRLPIRIADREWLMVVRSTGSSIAGLPPAARWTLIAGLLLSVMLFVTTRMQVNAWESAARHEAVLEASERALRESETQLRDLVAREREAREQAQAADRSKDEFLATLSHELRTPLNAVLGWLSMLRNRSLPEERRQHALDVVERNARLQAQLIEDLLDVSRIVTGKMKLDLQPVAVSAIASAVVDSLRPVAESTGVELHATIPADAGTTYGDVARIQQIVWNLLSNAIKFTPRGGQVWIELTEENSFVQLTVRDTGTGIVPEFLPHVFERFRQADSSTTRAHNGVGLGLAITHHLVELHGGTIAAQSEGAERGASFTVRLPAHAVPAVPPPLVARMTDLTGMRILVVDDDADTRDLLSQALGASGARVATANSAQGALDELVRFRADVLISDIAMPVEDGLSLIRRVRRMPGVGEIPAIALTALANDTDREQAIAAGFQLHLVKPVQLAALQAELAKLAAASSSRPAVS